MTSIGTRGMFSKCDALGVTATVREKNKHLVFCSFDKILTDDIVKEWFRPVTISQGREQSMYDTTKGRVVFLPR